MLPTRDDHGPVTSMNIRLSLCIRQPETETIAPAMHGLINRLCAVRWLETLTEKLVQMMLEVSDIRKVDK
jgi:hypothetical protein